MRTDATRLKQILKKLLANAFKFTQQGSVVAWLAPRAIAPGYRHWHRHPGRQARAYLRGARHTDGTTSRHYGGTAWPSISRELTRLLGGELSVRASPARAALSRW
jgi:hypothetical protein